MKKDKDKTERKHKKKSKKQSGKIYLQVSEARFNSTVDPAFRPLVVAQFDDQQAQSNVSRNPQQPTWNTNFLFNVSDLDSNIKIKIYNNSQSKENLMAETKISISHLGDAKQRVESFDVTGKFAGSISVVWRFESKAEPEVTTQIATEDVIGTFQFTVVGAANLKPRAGGGGRNAVAHLNFDDQKYSSPASNNTLAPQWDYALVFRVRNLQAPLKIRLLDHDTVKRTHLGSVEIPIIEIAKSRGSPTPVEAKKKLLVEPEDHPTDNSVGGEITVRFRYKDAASVTGNQDRAAKIYTDIKADVLAVPPEFPPGPPQEWKTIVPQRTTDREYKRGIRMKTLRNYWEDQLGLYQKKLQNGDTAGCQAVLKAVREEMAKEENQELFEDESKPPSVDMGMELEFPPPPQSVPESFPGDPKQFEAEYKQWRALKYLYGTWEDGYTKFIQFQKTGNRPGQLSIIQSVADAFKNSSVSPTTVIDFSKMGSPVPAPSRGGGYRASILPNQPGSARPPPERKPRRGATVDSRGSPVQSPSPAPVDSPGATRGAPQSSISAKWDQKKKQKQDATPPKPAFAPPHISPKTSEGTASGTESEGGLSSSFGEASPRDWPPTSSAEFDPGYDNPFADYPTPSPAPAPARHRDLGSIGHASPRGLGSGHHRETGGPSPRGLAPPARPQSSSYNDASSEDDSRFHSGEFGHGDSRPTGRAAPAKPMTPAELWHYEQQQKMLHEPNPFLTEESDLFESVGGEGEDGPIILPVSISTVEDTPVTGPFSLDTAIPDDGAPADLTFKIVIIGNSGVGKTNLLGRWIENKFENTSATISIEFATKSFFVQGKRVKVQLWDTAGQEKFRAISQQYYRNAHGAILVYDITSSDSYRMLETWLDPVIELSGNDDLMVMLVGNKIDMGYARQVATDDGLDWAEERGLFFLETSARDGTNVNRAFQILLQEIFDRQIAGSGPSNTSASVDGQTFVLRNENKEQEKESDCACW